MTYEEKLQGLIAVESMTVLEELLFLVDKDTWKEWRDYLLAAQKQLKVPTRIQVWNEWRLLKKIEQKEGRGKGAFEGVIAMCKMCRAIERLFGRLGKPEEGQVKE